MGAANLNPCLRTAAHDGCLPAHGADGRLEDMAPSNAPSTGRNPASVPRSDAPQVEIRRSARRRRTVQARWEDGRVVVLLPEGLDAAEERRIVESLVAKLARQQTRRSTGRSDEWLARRAVELARRHLDPVVGRPVRPAGVRWVSNMRTRWGSCTVQSGQIRISDVLAEAPEHVVECVLVHELAHLVVAGHDARFRRLEASHPRLAEANAWLAGWSAGNRAALRQNGMTPDGLDADALDADGLDADADLSEDPDRVD